MQWQPNKIGDVKIKKRFAWIPIETDSGITVWLEKYIETYKCLSYERQLGRSPLRYWCYTGKYTLAEFEQLKT